ncbi:subtilisin-like protease [Musa troglodytarum]|uniref:Subtilisin-like protease n=1 Tax=Musa troglodytarum TaxID=320322 RepID=A0A9E7ES01_9LILI|nr:subtilisin-like protease [Musa troglodytarum]URD81712.1 subtilisin-like protease [Musa troglodytarum]
MEVFKLFSSLCLLSFLLLTSAEGVRRRTYIVHVQPPESAAFGASSDRESWYRSFLATVSSEVQMIHMYTNVISGFAARLTESELEAMSAMPGFVRAYPDRMYRLQTTHTPAFLGLLMHQGLWNASNYGKGIIIGVLDTGIFPDHPSFSGLGMPPPPAKWRGRCDFNASSCNNKLIGARSFISGAMAMKGEAVASDSPIDDDGHGTHTTSTAAGAAVPGAEVLGNAKGMAIGMAPLAHVAMYKVCGEIDCASSDILAGMDAAVADGVDVLSLSLDEDTIAVGAFGAIEKGVFVSCAAGNSGPVPSTLSNEAPWILTVAASTMDRNIRVTVMLGNGLSFDGESIFQPNSFPPALYPLVYAGDPTSAFLFKGTILGTSPAPAITSFSSRGPSLASPGILKPDITGPGVSVLAATGTTFNIISGTSMSTPHLSGIAALIKSARPDWSPAAIKSAIMTTASVVDHSGKPIVNEQLLPADLFAIGAGHVNPVKASNPGLVYDLSADDYIAYLCGLGYASKQVSVIARRTIDCSAVSSIPEKDLNYPSISVTLGGNTTYAMVERRVKNVGNAGSTYWAEVGAPYGTYARVHPPVLRFNYVNQEKRFFVVFKMVGGGGGSQGYLKWVSVNHEVRSPISITYKH